MIVFYDPNSTVSNQIVAVYSGDTNSPWDGMTKLEDPTGAFTDGVPITYHKIDAGAITEMTQAEKDSVTTLPKAKRKKRREIDRRTQALISNGFVYATKTFSLSIKAQLNWMGIGINKDRISYPHEVSRKNGTVDIADAAEAQEIADLAFDTKQGHVKSGATHKKNVNALTTVSDVNAYVDPR